MIPAMSNENAFRVAVGELAQQSAVLESVVAIITWGIVGVTDTVGRIALPNSVDRSTRIIRDVAPHRISDAGLLSELNDWLSAVTRAYQDRNTILHSVWIGPSDQRTILPTSRQAPSRCRETPSRGKLTRSWLSLRSWNYSRQRESPISSVDYRPLRPGPGWCTDRCRLAK